MLCARRAGSRWLQFSQGLRAARSPPRSPSLNTHSTPLDGSSAPVLGSRAIEELHQQLSFALESASCVAASVEHAYLELDPTARCPKASLLVRYQGAARDELASAIDRYRSLHSKLGDAEMARLQTQHKDFSITLADAMLHCDHLSASIRKTSDKLAANVVECNPSA